jgi:hypothetical protein
MKPFDLEPWLRAHANRVERVGAELVFTHRNGETSVLVPNPGGRGDLLPVGTEPLASFYRAYLGASVGDSQLTFATNVPGGLEVSHGFRLPDFAQMTAQAGELGIAIPPSERAFLAEAAWMFVYTIADEGEGPVLRVYDRDYGTVRTVPCLEPVLDDWWSIVLAG